MSIKSALFAYSLYFNTIIMLTLYMAKTLLNNALRRYNKL